MAKYINGEALIDRLKKVSLTDDCFGMGVQTGINHAIECVQEAPAADVVSKETHEAVQKALVAFAETDVVQVVRCKDCTHWGDTSCQIKVSQYGLYSDDFCSYGERKEND